MAECDTNFDELITFDVELLDEWISTLIKDKFRSSLDQIRFRAAIKQHKAAKKASQTVSTSLPSCDVQQHSIHIVTLDTETIECCDQLKQHFDDTQNGISHLEKTLNDLSDSQQSTRRYLAEEYRKMIEEIDDLNANILMEVDTICSDKVEALEDQMDSLKSYLKQLNDAQQAVDTVLRDKSLNAQARKQKIMTSINQFIDGNISFHPVVSPFLGVTGTFNSKEFSQCLRKLWGVFEQGKPFHEPVKWLECEPYYTKISLSFEIPNTSPQILSSIYGYIVYHQKIDDESKEEMDDLSNFISVKINDAGSPKKHDLTHLSELTTYKILICTYNEYGNSVLSKPLNVKTKKSPWSRSDSGSGWGNFGLAFDDHDAYGQAYAREIHERMTRRMHE
eukprot:138396_1